MGRIHANAYRSGSYVDGLNFYPTFGDQGQSLTVEPYNDLREFLQLIKLSRVSICAKIGCAVLKPVA